jgi:hypothetical protein
MSDWSQIVVEQYLRLPIPLQSFLKTAAVAIPLVLIAAWIGGRLYLSRRETVDRAEPGLASQRDAIAREFKLPAPLDLEILRTEAMRSRGLLWRKRLHEPAIALKDKYYEIIGRCGFLLAFVFALLALELTVLRSETQLEQYSVTAGLFAILLVLLYWWRARVTNQAWVAKRILSELVRQWLHLVFVFSWSEELIQQEYSRLYGTLECAIVKPGWRILRWLGFALTPAMLQVIIQGHWRDTRETLTARIPTGLDRSDNTAFAIYLASRPINQLQWYRMREQQFASAGERRGMIMLGLFLFSFGLAAGNVLLVHWLNASQTRWPSSSTVTLEAWLNFCLLIATAISAALTYWYVSRNERSIAHRYSSQRRHIEIWLREIARLMKPGEHLPTFTNILEFEDLIVSELIDWVHITSHDVVELGP